MSTRKRDMDMACALDSSSLFTYQVGVYVGVGVCVHISHCEDVRSSDNTELAGILSS